MDENKIEKQKKIIQKRKERINQYQEKLKEERSRLKQDEELLRDYEFAEFFKVVSSNGITPQQAIKAVKKELDKIPSSSGAVNNQEAQGGNRHE